MSKEKEFNGVVDTENFTEDDYDDFLDYLEDIEDLDDDDDDDFVDIDDDDDDDETEVYDIVTTTNNKSLKRSNNHFGEGVNFNMSSKNGSNLNINSNGISFNISVDSIMDGISNISNSIKEAKYRNTMKQNKKLKEKLKRRK